MAALGFLAGLGRAALWAPAQARPQQLIAGQQGPRGVGDCPRGLRRVFLGELQFAPRLGLYGVKSTRCVNQPRWPLAGCIADVASAADHPVSPD